jgi:hypothetical protein
MPITKDFTRAREIFCEKKTRAVSRASKSLVRTAGNALEKFAKARLHPKSAIENPQSEIQNGPAWIRTRDQGIMSPLLYR